MQIGTIPNCLPRTFSRWQKFGIKGHDFKDGIILTLGCLGHPEGSNLVKSPVVLPRRRHTPVPLDSEHIFTNTEGATRIQSIATGAYEESLEIAGEGTLHELAVFENYAFINFSNVLYRNKLGTSELVKIKENVEEFALIESVSKTVVGMLTSVGVLSFVDARTLEDWGRKRAITQVVGSYGFGKLVGISKSQFVLTFQGCSQVKFFDIFFETEIEVSLPGAVWNFDVFEEKVLFTLQQKLGLVVLDSRGRVLMEIRFSPQEPATSENNYSLFIDENHVLLVGWRSIQVWNVPEKKFCGQLPVDKKFRLTSAFHLPLTKEESRDMVRYFVGHLLEFSPLPKDTAEIVAKFI